MLLTIAQANADEISVWRKRLPYPRIRHLNRKASVTSSYRGYFTFCSMPSKELWILALLLLTHFQELFIRQLSTWRGVDHNRILLFPTDHWNRRRPERTVFTALNSWLVKNPSRLICRRRPRKGGCRHFWHLSKSVRRNLSAKKGKCKHLCIRNPIRKRRSG